MNEGGDVIDKIYEIISKTGRLYNAVNTTSEKDKRQMKQKQKWYGNYSKWKQVMEFELK